MGIVNEDGAIDQLIRYPWYVVNSVSRDRPIQPRRIFCPECDASSVIPVVEFISTDIRCLGNGYLGFESGQNNSIRRKNLPPFFICMAYSLRMETNRNKTLFRAVGIAKQSST